MTKQEYTRTGSEALGQQLEQQLRSQGLNAFIIPVGGSNSLGTWGYIEAINEIRQQEPEAGSFTDIVMVRLCLLAAGPGIVSLLDDQPARVYACM